MNVDFERLVRAADEADAAARTTRDMLNAKRSRCRHKWPVVQYTPIVREGYQDPGDGDDWHGADKRFPHWVERTETPRWTRTCSECGLEEITERVKESVTKTPVF